MRILFIAPSAYLLGGVQDWLYTTVLGLRERGHIVKVGVPDDYFHNGRQFNKHFNGLEAEFFRNRSGTNEGRIRALERFLRKNRTDIIVGVNIGNLFEAVSRTIRESHEKFVMTVHAIEHNYYQDMKQYGRLVSGVVATNKLSALLAEKVGSIDKNRVYYAPYGVDQEESSSNKRIGHMPLMIAWVGRLEQAQKRARDIVGVLKYLDELNISYKLEIAGDGPEKDGLLTDMSTWIKAGKVEFLGVVMKENMKSFYKKHHILLVTSEWETGPIVAWEAIRAGLAVVTSAYIGSRAEQTLIDERTALMFDIGDTRNAAKQLARLSNEDLRQRLNLNARAIVEKKYSVKASIDAWEGAFEDIYKSKTQIRSDERILVVQTSTTGRLEKYLGMESSEFIRSVLPKRIGRNAGDEWPHSLQGIRNQDWILENAKEIEQSYKFS